MKPLHLTALLLAAAGSTLSAADAPAKPPAAKICTTCHTTDANQLRGYFDTLVTLNNSLQLRLDDRTEVLRFDKATLKVISPEPAATTEATLKAIAKGNGPKHAILALGYAGWAPGQLESEIQHNGWLHCPADPDLIFGRDVEDKYQRALNKIGIDVGMLSNAAGHA